MFIAREKELAILQDTYNKPGFQMTVIYGRRRIGKSRLITEFIKGKRASYYVASKTSLELSKKPSVQSSWSKVFRHEYQHTPLIHPDHFFFYKCSIPRIRNRIRQIPFRCVSGNLPAVVIREGGQLAHLLFPVYIDRKAHKIIPGLIFSSPCV